MLDHPDKTTKLLVALKAAVPFEVELPARIKSNTPCPTSHTLATKVASCVILCRPKNKKYSLSP